MAAPKTQVRIAFGSDPGSSSPVWTDVTEFVRGFEISRGRQHELGRVEPGTCSIVLANRDRRFDPLFAGARVNFIENPSAEVDTQGAIQSGGSSVARSTAQAQAGTASFLHTVTNAGPGVFTLDWKNVDGSRIAVQPSTTYTFSVYVRASSGTPLVRLVVSEYAAASGGSPTTQQSSDVAASGSWVRRTLTFTTGPTTSYVIVSAYLISAVNGNAVHYDAVQLEQASAAGTYVDGTVSGNRWSGTAHASATIRGGDYFPNVLPMRRVSILVGENDVDNPRAEAGVTGWSGFDGGAGGPGNYALTTAADAPQGFAQTCFVAADTATNSGANSIMYPTSLSEFRAVAPGDKAFLSAWVKSMGGNVSAIHIVARYLNSSGVYAGESTALASVSSGLTNWNRLAGTVTIPAGVSYVSVQVYFVLTSAAAYTVRVTNLQVAGYAQPYVDRPYPLFDGFVERWPASRKGPSDAEVEITCVDALAPLAAVDLDNYYGAALSGARIDALLNDVGWPAGSRAIDAGLSQLDDSDLADSGTPALEHLLEVGESENGIVFADGSGRVTFHDRTRRLRPPYTTPAASFGDNPAAELPYVDLEPSYDVDELYNEVVVTVPGDPLPATASDTTSQSKFLRRTLSKSTLLAAWDEAQEHARYLVSRFKDPSLRFDSMTVRPNPSNDADPLWQQALGRELSDRVKVTQRPPGPAGGDPQVRECHVEGIAIRMQGLRCEVQFQLSPADALAYWVVGDSLNGVLGVTTRLGY